jgi:hypothetical protein
MENVAEESHKTKKVREKLKRHLDQIERQVTKKALEQKTSEIHRWIARHALQRVPLKNKEIALFDENQNVASVSQRIRKLSMKLQKTFEN